MNIILHGIEYIIGNKQRLSGIAILMIILCHTGLNVFYPWFMGVDIFMFLSGYFLCVSYNKNSLSTFYRNRYKRIVAIWLLLSLTMTSVEYFMMGTPVGWWEVFCNLTTLSYYGLGIGFVDWYLSSLFMFYLLFPIFYKLMKCKWNLWILLLLLLSVFILFAVIDLHWRYECAIGRIPVFCMGMLLYNEGISVGKKTKAVVITSFLLVVPAIFLYIHKLVATYYLFYLIAPLCICLIGYVLSKVRINKIDYNINLLGKYSLEIYVANIIALNTFYFYNLGVGQFQQYYLLLSLD